MSNDVMIVRHPTVDCLCSSDGWVLVPGFTRNGANIPAKWTKGSLHCHKLKSRDYFYYVVRIKGKKYKVHRLICEAFHPNPSGKPHVDHIDRNPMNNDESNLEWATTYENRANQDRNDLARTKVGLTNEASSHALKIAYGHKYYAENRARLLEQKKTYYSKNRGKILEYQRCRHAQSRRAG